MKTTARHLTIAATTALVTACAPENPVDNALYRAPDGPIGRVLWSDEHLREAYRRFVKSCVVPSSVPRSTMMDAVDARDARLNEMQQDGTFVETLIEQELHQPWLWDSRSSASLRRAYEKAGGRPHRIEIEVRFHCSRGKASAYGPVFRYDQEDPLRR